MDIWTNRPPNKRTNEQTNHWAYVRNTRRLAIRAHSSSVPYDLTIVRRVYSQFRLMAVLYISAISIVFAPLNSIIRPSRKKFRTRRRIKCNCLAVCSVSSKMVFMGTHTHTHIFTEHFMSIASNPCTLIHSVFLYVQSDSAFFMHVPDCF